MFFLSAPVWNAAAPGTQMTQAHLNLGAWRPNVCLNKHSFTLGPPCTSLFSLEPSCAGGRLSGSSGGGLIRAAVDFHSARRAWRDRRAGLRSGELLSWCLTRGTLRAVLPVAL